jgi:hypothetical protein
MSRQKQQDRLTLVSWYISLRTSVDISKRGFPLSPPVSSACTNPSTASGLDVVVLDITCTTNVDYITSGCNRTNGLHDVMLISVWKNFKSRACWHQYKPSFIHLTSFAQKYFITRHLSETQLPNIMEVLGCAQ